jgi:hypothetical protein
MFYIAHRNGETLAARAPEGELMSPRYATDDFADACDFGTFAEASEVAQNFGPDWSVEEV